MHVVSTLPNLISLARLVLMPFTAKAILDRQYQQAIALFLVAGLTDVFDGFLARRLHATSRLGAWVDPIADKALLSAIYLALGVSGILPWWLVWIVLGRDIFLLTSAGVVLSFTALRDFPPSVWGKGCTFIQILTAFLAMWNAAWTQPELRNVTVALIWLAAAATLWSGIHYLWRTVGQLRAKRSG